MLQTLTPKPTSGSTISLLTVLALSQSCAAQFSPGNSGVGNSIHNQGTQIKKGVIAVIVIFGVIALAIAIFWLTVFIILFRERKGIKDALRRVLRRSPRNNGPGPPFAPGPGPSAFQNHHGNPYVHESSAHRQMHHTGHHNAVSAGQPYGAGYTDPTMMGNAGFNGGVGMGGAGGGMGTTGAAV